MRRSCAACDRRRSRPACRARAAQKTCVRRFAPPLVLADRRVLLIDDVRTTGATAAEAGTCVARRRLRGGLDLGAGPGRALNAHRATAANNGRQGAEPRAYSRVWRLLCRGRSCLGWACRCLLACVSVPRGGREEADAALDAAWPDEAALDGGTGRPPTGAPYVGPECDPAPASGAGDPSTVAGDGGAWLADGSASPSSSETPGSGSPGSMVHASDPDQPHAARHPLEGEIAITEIMSNPAAVADTAGEWFELHNPSADEALDLGGCSVDDGSAKPHAVPAPFVIASGEYVVVGRGAEAGFVAGSGAQLFARQYAPTRSCCAATAARSIALHTMRTSHSCREPACRSIRRPTPPATTLASAWCAAHDGVRR